MPRPKTKRVPMDLTAHLDVRMTPQEKADIALFCEERALLVPQYVRNCLRVAIRETRRHEYLMKLRQGADRLPAEIAEQQFEDARPTLAAQTRATESPE